MSLWVTGHFALARIVAAHMRKSGHGDESHGWNLFSTVGTSGESGGSRQSTDRMKFPKWRRLLAADGAPEQETSSGCNGWGRVLAAGWTSMFWYFLSKRTDDDAKVWLL